MENRNNDNKIVLRKMPRNEIKPSTNSKIQNESNQITQILSEKCKSNFDFEKLSCHLKSVIDDCITINKLRIDLKVKNNQNLLKKIFFIIQEKEEYKNQLSLLFQIENTNNFERFLNKIESRQNKTSELENVLSDFVKILDCDNYSNAIKRAKSLMEKNARVVIWEWANHPRPVWIEGKLTSEINRIKSIVKTIVFYIQSHNKMEENELREIYESCRTFEDFELQTRHLTALDVVQQETEEKQAEIEKKHDLTLLKWITDNHLIAYVMSPDDREKYNGFFHYYYNLYEEGYRTTQERISAFEDWYQGEQKEKCLKTLTTHVNRGKLEGEQRKIFAEITQKIMYDLLFNIYTEEYTTTPNY